MTDDLNSLDFDDDVLDGEGNGGDGGYQEPPFDPDTYVKPYIGANGEPEPDIVQEPSDPDGDDNDDDDLITALLKSKGIKNTASIKFEAEDGTIEEKDFNSLTREEQLAILTSSEEIDSPELEDEEINFLNTLREDNISISDYINWIKEQAVEEFIAAQGADAGDFEIDSLSDEELYLLDLKDTSPDLTDEECLAALEHEKGNTILWEKRMQGLRNSYKAKETARKEEERLAQEEEDQRKQLEFQNAIVDAVGKVDSIGEFDLEDEDKEEIAEFILGTDKTGVRYFAKALNDPETLTKMAWFALNGEEALDTLSKYYKEQIDEFSRSNYKKGFEDGKKGAQTTPQKNTKTTKVQKPVTPKEEPGVVKPINNPIYIDLD